MMVMMVFSTVAKKVLTPKTSAQSSLEREVAIWKLGKNGSTGEPLALTWLLEWEQVLRSNTYMAMGTRNWWEPRKRM